MTDIEQKALALMNEVRTASGLDTVHCINRDFIDHEALCHAIERHEATKQELSDFRQEVSDVASVCAQHFCENSWTVGDRQDHVDMLSRLIIPKPKPDPLINVAKMLGYYNTAAKHLAGDIRSALDAAGFEIREKNDGHS